MSLEESEQAAAAVAKTPNRVSLADIENKVAAKWFVTGRQAVMDVYGDDTRSVGDEFDGFVDTKFAGPLDILTLCIVVTTTGFTLVGKSAPADPENFDADLGKKLAYEDVLKQLWPLMGFALREKLSEQ